MKINFSFSHVVAAMIGFIAGMGFAIAATYASQLLLADASLAMISSAGQQAADAINYTWVGFALAAAAELTILFVYVTLGSATAHSLTRNRSTKTLLIIGIVFFWPIVLIAVGTGKFLQASDTAGIALAERLHEWVAR